MTNATATNETLNLNCVGMLVEVTASVWTARKLDRKKTEEVVTNAGARNKGAARVNKHLLAGRPELESISTLVAEARNYLYANTTPWSDNGQRFIVQTRIPAFDKRMQEYIDRFNVLVADFVAVYPTLITAQAMALGDMFDRNEYPLPAEIARKFALNCEYLPMPASGDIRIDISAMAVDELKARLEHANQARVAKIMDDVRKRLTEHLERMVDRLATDTNDKTGAPEHRRFTESLVVNAWEVCEMIKDYNVTGDPKLAQAREVLESKLAGVTANKLRDDHDKREDVRAAANALLGQFAF